MAETRRVRVRDSGKQLFADVTVAARRTATLERAHDISEAVEREIQRVAPGADVVVHVEPSTEAEGIVERVQAAASRIDGVHEVHNVQVRAFDERDRGEALHVTFHAKARAGITLEQAHDLSERIEEAVKNELGARVRVDTHLEPLEPAALGHDVTSARQDVVSAVRTLALQQRDVVDCHEIVVTEAEDKLSVTTHVRARRDLPLASIHGASERIEKAIHQALPEVGSVVIHFEPA